MSIVGIDAGNSRMKVAIPDSQGNPVMLVNSNGELFTPSVVYFDKDRILVGTEAINAGFIDPSRCVRDWKRHMGTNDILYTTKDGKEHKAKDVLQIFQAHIKTDYEAKTGRPMHEIVISEPANYTDVQKNETIEAAEAIGLKVLIMPHEPTAAAIGNNVHKRGNGLVLVLDLGGGTYDVSLLEVSGNNVEVKLSDGEPDLGGQDFNNRIQELIFREFEQKYGFIPTLQDHPLVFQSLFQQVEQAKISLSQREQVPLTMHCNGQVLNTTLTRKQFMKVTMDLIDKAVTRAEEVLRQGQVSADQIKEIISVGGASRTYGFAEAIEKRLGKKPTSCVEPDYAAAKGNVIIGRIELERQGQSLVVDGYALPPSNIFLQEVTTHPIGVCVLSADGKLVNAVILPKGTRIPSVQTKRFKLAQPNQTDAQIQILQGENNALKDKCVLLGELVFEDLTPVSDGVHPIDIKCKIDVNGILTATAYDPTTGQSVELKLKYKNDHSQNGEEV